MLANQNIYYEPYFYPLDVIKNWNVLYGKKGFFQYQFVIPFSAGFDGMKKIIDSNYKNDCDDYAKLLENLHIER